MRFLFTCFLVTLLTFSLGSSEVFAKRFGGGRSFGVQRSYSSLNSAKQGKFFNQSKQRSSRWGGLLGGLLIGGLLSSLLMGHGLGSGLLSWLFIGFLIYMVLNFLRRMRAPAYQTNNQSYQNQHSPFNNVYTNTPLSSSTNETVDNFSKDDFLREAKVIFIRLQAAYDQKNLEDLQSFTAPEVFAEIKMQFDERGDKENKTEVRELQAELLDFTNQAGTLIASVRFNGLISEDGEQTSLDEIWHFRKFKSSNQWIVGGIQQEVFH